jgi:hypothetical protein
MMRLLAYWKKYTVSMDIRVFYSAELIPDPTAIDEEFVIRIAFAQRAKR